MIALIIIIVVVALIFYAVSDRAEKNGHEWLVPLIAIIFLVGTTALGLFDACKSCTNSSPQYDYYDDAL